MKTQKLTVFFIVSLLALSACKRDSLHSNTNDTPGSNNPVTLDIKDLVVPAGFNFETEKTLNIRVGVQNPSFPGERFVIKIYSDVPSTGALMVSGITTGNNEFKATVRIPAWEENIYVEKVNADGSSEYNKVKANTFVSTQFGGQGSAYFFRKSGSGMDCSTGCSAGYLYNNHVGNISVPNGKTACITGTFSGNITISGGGIVKICGNADIGTFTMNGNSKAYILENAIVSIDDLTTNGSQTVFKNWCDSLYFTTDTDINGEIRNEGKIDVSGNLNVNSNSSSKNYGTININGGFEVDKEFKNYGHIIVEDDMTNTANGDFENYCHLHVKGNLTNNGDMWNNTFIKVGGKYDQNSNGNTKLDDGGFLSVKDLELNKEMEGTGSNRSLIKVAANTTIFTNGKIKGTLDICDSSGIETNNGSITSPAAQSCNRYLPTTTCNPEGFGNPPIQDADNDGIADAQDEYPNDGTRAFNSYYPNANTTASLAFEDLWPSMGDFDYNDMVVAFNIQKVLNAAGKVVDYKVKLRVKAVGASFDNGFGFRLDEVLPAEVANVTGQSLIRSIVSRNANNTEAAQDKAVIICFDSPEPSLHRATGSMFNTIKANPTGTSDTMYVNVTFTSPIDDAKLDISKFNPFIFTNRRRGYEVHLGNYKPTSLANATLFGTEKDRSEPANNKYYKTPNNLPWAILLPVGFDYPVERTAVTSAYNFFDDWAISGGNSYSNWYTNQSEYRVEENIY